MKETLKYDLTIHVGADYKVLFAYQEDDGTPIDVSDWTAVAQLREYPESDDFIAFTCTSYQEGFLLELSAEKTSQITYTRGVYDVFVTDPDDYCRFKLVQGRVRIVPNVTR